MKPAWLLQYFFSDPSPALREAGEGSLCPPVAVTIHGVYGWDPQSPDPDPGSCSGVPDRASPCPSWLMEPRQCCISRCPEQSIYYIHYLHNNVLTFLLGCLEAVELNWPAHLSCPQTRCCHTEYTLNGASVLTSSLQHPEVVQIYVKRTCIELWVVFTPAEVLTFRFCVLSAKVARIQHLCFADKHISGAGAAAVLQLHWICCQDLPLAFWVWCFKWCLYFHTIMILPLLCALKPLWLLKCSIWGCSVSAVYKIGWAVLPSEAARDFRGILWTLAWQWVWLKSICSGKAEGPVVPLRCHRKWLHPAWNLGLVTWKCSQKVLVLPSSSGGKSVVLNYNFQRKKTHTFCSSSMVTFWFVFFLVKIVPSRSDWEGKQIRLLPW